MLTNMSSAPLSHLAPGRPVQLMSFDFVARLVVVVDGIKAYVNVNTDVVASWIWKNIVKRNQLLSNYYRIFVQF